MLVLAPVPDRFGLAFETSGACGEVALGRGNDIVDRIALREPRAHARGFVAAVAEICERNHIRPGDVGALLVSVGPGSFTGLRIGVTVARMLAFGIVRSGGTEPSVVAVPTMQAIAQNALLLSNPPDEVCVLVDAQRGQVFAATFRLGDASIDRSDAGATTPKGVREFQPVGDAREAAPEPVLSSLSGVCALMGDGIRRHRALCEASGRRILPEEAFASRVDSVYELGCSMLRRGQAIAARLLTPFYIRVPDAEEKWSARHGAGA